MVIIGIGLLFMAYTAGFYGYCLIRGYDITPKQLFSSTWPPIVTSPNTSSNAGPLPKK